MDVNFFTKISDQGLSVNFKLFRCNKMDEIWVPTQFSKDIFMKEGVEEGKLKIIPEPVDTEIFDPSKVTALIPNTDKSTKFISIFKWETRKGWDILISAYLSEFKKNENVILYILTSKYHHESRKSFRTIIQEYAKENMKNLVNLPKIEILESVSGVDLPRLLKSMDCMVIPSRGEGWGRPHVEAMSMELPVIATNWSGNTEFMNNENSYLLEIEGLVPVSDGAFKNSGMKWANPSVKHLKKLMRNVFENPTEAKEKGKIARRDMVEKYSPKIVSEIIAKELKRISKK
jgi:glycosyltransferase involved in cell wall biosynthesis